MSETIVVTVPEHRKYQWWRDVVILVLAITVGCLVVLVLRGQEELAEYRDEQRAVGQVAATERAELQTTLDKLDRDLAEARLANARAAAEIRRLTDLLIAAGLDPGQSLVDTNSDGDVDLGSTGRPPAPDPATTAPPTPRPTASRTPAPRPPASPAPRPSPRPSPSPAPQPLVPIACDLLPILPGCPDDL